MRASLRTGNVQEARFIRDTYLMPVIAMDGAIEALEQIAAKIEYLEGDVDRRFEELKARIVGGGQITFGEAFERYKTYLGDSGLRPASMRDYVDAIRDVVRYIGEDMELSKLTKSMVVRYREENQSKLSSARLHFKFQRFRGFVKWCVDDGLAQKSLLDCLDVSLPSIRTNHTVAIREEDADAAMLVKDGWTLAPRIARYTGMRLREVLRLESGDIREVDGVLCIDIDKRTKTGIPRLVPVADKLRDWLDDLSELSDTKKQHNHYNTIVKKIDPAYKFHSWRAYAISQMTKNGVDPIVRMRVVGHKSSGELRIHSDYTTVELEQMKKAVDTIF